MTDVVETELGLSTRPFANRRLLSVRDGNEEVWGTRRVVVASQDTFFFGLNGAFLIGEAGKSVHDSMDSTTAVEFRGKVRTGAMRPVAVAATAVALAGYGLGVVAAAIAALPIACVVSAAQAVLHGIGSKLGFGAAPAADGARHRATDDAAEGPAPVVAAVEAPAPAGAAAQPRLSRASTVVPRTLSADRAIG